MHTRCIVATLLLAVCSSVGQAETIATLSRSAMKPGQVYRFQTTGRTYQAQVIDHKSGECLVSALRDGVTFTKPRKAFILGATRGDQAGIHFVIMSQVKVGLGIELAVNDYGKQNRYLTPEVIAIELLEPATPGTDISGETEDQNSA